MKTIKLDAQIVFNNLVAKNASLNFIKYFCSKWLFDAYWNVKANYCVTLHTTMKFRPTNNYLDSWMVKTMSNMVFAWFDGESETSDSIKTQKIIVLRFFKYLLLKLMYFFGLHLFTHLLFVCFSLWDLSRQTITWRLNINLNFIQI